MRPDLLLFARLAGAGPLNMDSLEQARERSRCKVHIVEVGFCMETAYMTGKTCSASAIDYPPQGGRLRGCQGTYAHFGSTGGIFHLTAQHSKQLGITGPPSKLSKTLLENLHFRALKRLEQLVGTRRRLKHQPNEPDNRKRKQDE